MTKFFAKQKWAAVYDFLLNLIWPPACVVCRRYSKSVICDECREKGILYQFGSRFEGEYGYALPSVPSCKKVYAVAEYCDGFGEAVRNYKFKGELWIGNALGELMYEMAVRAGLFEKVKVITYVPVSDERLKSRGFDQSLVIAEILSKKSGVSCVQMLRRVSQGKTQSKAGRAERIMQSKNRFEIDVDYVDKDGLCGVLLIDDIITTGSTLEECAGLLVQSGFINIYGIAVATGRKDI